MSHTSDSKDAGVAWSTTPITDNYMRGSDWRGKWRQAAAAVQHQSAEQKRPQQQQQAHFVKPTTNSDRPATGGPVIMDWRKVSPAGVSPTKRSRPWSGEPHWHHGKGHHGGKGHHHEAHGWPQQQAGEWQGEQQWGENGWWNWEGAPNAEDDQKWLPGYDQQGDGCWNQDTQYNHGGGDTNAWSGDGPWQGRAWTDQQQGSTDPQETPAPEPTSEEPATKKPRSASKSPDAPQPGGSTSFVNALRKLFKAKNAAPAKPPPSNTATTNNPSLWEAGKGPDNNKPQGGGALASLLAKQASGTSASSTAKAPSPGPSPGSPSGGPSDTELRKNVLTRLLSSDNAGELLEDPKVVEMLLQVASQLDETGLADLQKSVVKIITKLQSSSSAAANGGAGDLPPDQLAKRNACVERLKAILEGLRGLFLKRQEERINQGKASAAAAAAAQQSKAATTTTSTSNTSHSALASLLSGVSAQNQPIYDHKVWTGYVQRSGVNKAKVNLYATLPVHSLTTDMVAQLGNELNLKLRVPDNEVLHQRQIHSESSSLLLMKADSAADQAELNAQIAYFNGRSRSGVAKLERDGVHYAAFMIPPGPLAEK